MATKAWKDAEEVVKDYYATFGKQAHLQRLSDTAHVKTETGLKKAWRDAQPADFILSYGGTMAYVEVKTSTNPTSFPLSNISKEQMKCAVQSHAAGGEYLFFIRSEAKEVWFSMFISDLLEFQKHNPGKKSIPWGNFSEAELINNFVRNQA